DHKIVRPAGDWIDKLIHEPWDVTAVAIEENDNVTFRRKRMNAGSASASISARRGHQTRACFLCALGGSICAPVINDDDLVRQPRPKTLGHNTGDWFLFIKRGENA